MIHVCYVLVGREVDSKTSHADEEKHPLVAKEMKMEDSSEKPESSEHVHDRLAISLK